MREVKGKDEINIGMKSFKQFLMEATVYHGSTDYMFPGEQVNPKKYGAFHMTPNLQQALGYAFNDISKSAETSGQSATDPTVTKFDVDDENFIMNVSPETSSKGSRMGSQASRRAVIAKGRMSQELKKAGAPSVEQQIWKLFNAGKGTQGQQSFGGEITAIPKSGGELQYVIPPSSKVNIRKTGVTDNIEDYGEQEFTPLNIPQTSIARPTTQRPNIGVSAFKGVQLSGKNLNRSFRNTPVPDSYFDLAPLDGDNDGINANLDPDDPLHRER